MKECYLPTIGNMTQPFERVGNVFEIEDFEYTIDVKVFVDLTIDQALNF